MEIRALVFDLDDTLYPERDYVRSGYKAVSEWCEQRLGLSAVLTAAELLSLFDAGFRTDAFQWWLAEKGLPDDLLGELVEVYRSHAPDLSLPAETRVLLNEWKRSRKIGLVTEGRSEAQRAKIAALGLENFFDAVVVTGDGNREDWKPSPKPFREVLTMLGVDGPEAVYIGDNPRKDFRGAREVGMRTIRLRRPDGLHNCVEPATPEDAPDGEITELSALEGVVLRPAG